MPSRATMAASQPPESKKQRRLAKVRLYHAVVISALVGMFFAYVLACTTAEPDAIAEPDAMLAHAQDELKVESQEVV